MSLFDNAVQAIEIGIADFQDGSDARLKSSVRNVHAGILLLFKHKLKDMSPTGSDEVLLKQRIEPVLTGGTVTFRGKGRKTVDLQTMKERFESLNVRVDWDAFESLGRIRNEIEHYFTEAGVTVIMEALSKSFAVASRFAATQLDIDLREHLSKEAWDQLVEIKEFYDSERQRCRESQADFQSTSEYAQGHLHQFTCSTCYSDLIFFSKSGAVCRVCGRTWNREQAEVAVVAKAGGSDYYDSVKDGADETVVNCPACGELAFVIAESRCVCCGESSETLCQRCGIPIPASEINGSGYCGWCNNAMSKKD